MERNASWLMFRSFARPKRVSFLPHKVLSFFIAHCWILNSELSYFFLRVRRTASCVSRGEFRGRAKCLHACCLAHKGEVPTGWGVHSPKWQCKLDLIKHDQTLQWMPNECNVRATAKYVFLSMAEVRKRLWALRQSAYEPYALRLSRHHPFLCFPSPFLNFFVADCSYLDSLVNLSTRATGPTVGSFTLVWILIVICWTLTLLSLSLLCILQSKRGNGGPK